MTKSLAHHLAEYRLLASISKIFRAEVVHEVKRRVIDSIGCALGAWNEEPCVIAREGRVGFFGEKWRDHHRHASSRRRRIGRRSRPAVAFAISITTTPIFRKNRRIRAIISPRSSRWRKAWARTDAKLITAAALAYEVQCRFCDAASIRARGWDHPTYGAFSTALAAAQVDEARSGKNAARGQHRRRELRGVSAGAGRGTFALERRRLRECGAARRLRGAARARGHDRAGADFRRRRWDSRKNSAFR